LGYRLNGQIIGGRKMKRQRIQVNVSDEMITRLELYSTKMGISRSALCAQFIGQAIMGYDKAFDVIDNYGNKLLTDEYEKTKK